MNNLIIFKKEKNKYIEFGRIWSGVPHDGIWLIKDARKNEIELISEKTNEHNIDMFIKNYSFGKKEFFSTLEMFSVEKCSLSKITYLMFMIFALNLSTKTIKSDIINIIDLRYNKDKVNENIALFYKKNPKQKYSRYESIKNHPEYGKGIFSAPIEGVLLKSESDDFKSNKVLFGLDVYNLFNEKNIEYLQSYEKFDQYCKDLLKKSDYDFYQLFNFEN